METEHFFHCPYCGERISMLVDTSVREQSYIEDCEVCCRPIQVSFVAEPDGGISWFSAEAVP
jgi:transcription elongation factor Elf1